jgi:hypothetical protein
MESKKKVKHKTRAEQCDQRIMIRNNNDVAGKVSKKEYKSDLQY